MCLQHYHTTYYYCIGFLPYCHFEASKSEVYGKIFLRSIISHPVQEINNKEQACKYQKESSSLEKISVIQPRKLQS